MGKEDILDSSRHYRPTTLKEVLDSLHEMTPHSAPDSPDEMVKERESYFVDRTIDEDYDAMDVSSDTDPSPRTPTSESGSFEAPATKENIAGAYLSLSSSTCGQFNWPFS